jgi:hypothetical protein
MNLDTFPQGWLAAPPTTLRISVHTVCVVGVEPVGPHEADLDTVLDASGLPYVPKNRMSARLRDAALAVVTSAGGDAETVSAAIELFGAAYDTGSARRLVQVGAAVWPDAAQAAIAAALAGQYQRREQALLRKRITEAMTVRVGQTRIGADGAPARGSLRYLRGIRPGVVLDARLWWREPPQPRHLRVLARSVLALTQIGDGESDNLGRVSCSLAGDFAATAACAFEELRA